MKTASTVSAIALTIIMTAIPTFFAVAASGHVPTDVVSSSEHNARLIDFNNPTTLAWSLELGGTTAPALHDATCKHTTVRAFECHGLTTDNQPHTEEITVSVNGSSWASN